MDVPRVSDIDLFEKTVVARCEFDVDESSDLSKNTRASCAVELVKYIFSKNPKRVFLISHKGRPEGFEEKESLKFIADYLSTTLGESVKFISFDEFNSNENLNSEGRILLLENLRFWEGEKNNDPEFVGKLMRFNAQVYVNEAFSVSQREAASIVGLPAAIKKSGGQIAAGLRLSQEIEVLEKLRNNPERPFVALISGIKKDKLSYLESFLAIADKVVLAGRLPVYVNLDYGEAEIVDDTKILDLAKNPKVFVAGLNQDREDITLSSIEKIEEIVSSAKTILVSGPLGKYEDEGHRLGTKRVLEAVSQSSAYKVAGGGDTEEALVQFAVNEKFDWVSVGGGACLEFLSKGTLPGIEAIKV